MTNTRNIDLEAVQFELADTLDKLRDQMDAATDAATIQALAHEIIEVDHRITLVGRLIFKTQTTAITAAAQKVGAAKASVDAAIANIARLNTALKTISSFLALVDKVIDVAKLI